MQAYLNQDALTNVLKYCDICDLGKYDFTFSGEPHISKVIPMQISVFPWHLNCFHTHLVENGGQRRVLVFLSLIFVCGPAHVILTKNLFPFIRLGLCTKNGMRDTLSMAPALNLTHIQSRHPFECVIQYTGANLRYFSMERSDAQIIPILRHLSTHCTALRHFRLCGSLLLKPDFYLAMIAKIVSRVEILEFIPDQSNPGQVLARFCDMLELVQTPLKIKSLDLIFPSEEDAIIQRLAQVFRKKLAARLEHVRISLRLNDEMIPSMLRDFLSLKSVAILLPESDRQIDPADLNAWIKSRALALSKTQVGINFSIAFGTLKVPSHAFNNLTKFRLTDPLRDLMERLQRNFGLQVPIASRAIGRYISDITFHDNVDVDMYEDSLKFIASGECPLLPSLESVSYELSQNMFAQRLAFSASLPKLICALGVLGNVILPPAQLVCGLIMCDPIDPARMTALTLAGVFESSAFYMDPLPVPLLASAKSTDSLNWLLDRVPKEDLEKFISQHSSTTGKRPFMLTLLAERKLSDVDLICKSVGNASQLFSFPKDEDFLSIAKECVALQDLQLLKRIVEATGLENISASSRGELFWLLRKRWKEAFDYWDQLLKSDPAVEPNFFAGVTPLSGFWASLRENNPLPGFESLTSTVLRWKGAIIRNASPKSAFELFQCLLDILLDPSLTVDADPLIQDFAAPLSQVLSRSGKPATALAIVSTPRQFLFDRLLSVVQVTLKADFDPSNSTYHPQYRETLAATMIPFLNQSMNCRTAKPLLLLCLEHLDGASLNSLRSAVPYSLMDLFVRTHFSDDWDQNSRIIEMVVQKGGRISDPRADAVLRDTPSTVMGADPELLDMYYDALTRAK
jgi:hypothetical protein